MDATIGRNLGIVSKGELVKKKSTPMDHSCSDTSTFLKELGHRNIE